MVASRNTVPPDGRNTMAPSVTYASEVITPETAREWLKKYNKHNRDMREWRIRLLATDIENDNLIENGEVGITFDWNGHVAGGQHTLAAIERAGKPVRVRVTRGVDPRSRDTMNDTLKERLSDRFKGQGIPNAVYAEPMIRKVMVWETVAADHKGLGGLDLWRGARYSRAQLMAAWPTYAAGIITSLGEAGVWYDAWPQGGNRGALQFTHWLLTEKHGMNREKVDRFFDIVAYGSDDARERGLRMKLLKKFMENHNAEYQVYWLMRTWNYWVHQENPSKFQGPKGGFHDPYPRLRVVRLWIRRYRRCRHLKRPGRCGTRWG